jgi:hypothetical protein
MWILASGAPTEAYEDLPVSLRKTMGEFFRMDMLETLYFGNSMLPDAEERFSEFLQKANEIGSAL